MKTQITLILLVLVGGSIYAAHGEETPLPVSNDINVTAPHQTGTWSFGATAVLLQPMNQAFLYAALQTDVSEELPQIILADKYENVNPGYHWWFGADISYAFPGNGRDVTLAYEGLRGNDSAQVSATDMEQLYSIPDFADLYHTAKGETQINYDAADLLFGQKLDVGTRIGLHPFIGLRYAYINVKDTANYSGGSVFIDPVTYSATKQNTWNSTFNGIGPRFGSDAEINLGEGFSVHARLGLSALIGSTNPDFNSIVQTYDDDGALVDTFPYTAGQGSSTHLIPEIDGRLGLNYTYHFDSNMALGVEAGWQASNYFNAVYQLAGDPGDEAVDSSNFGLQGPYARLQLDIA